MTSRGSYETQAVENKKREEQKEEEEVEKKKKNLTVFEKIHFFVFSRRKEGAV